MSHIVATIVEHNDKYLVCKLEVLDYGFIVYGRARDNRNEEQHRMLTIMDSPITNHPTAEIMDHHHPNGSPKKRGEYYWHHIHYEGDLNGALKRLDKLVKEGLMSEEMAFKGLNALQEGHNETRN